MSIGRGEFGAADDGPSYRALLRVPSLPRIIVGTQLARVAQTMVGITLVLFSLGTYASPELAAVVTFASMLPGLLVSPIAGALLDRHGRIRLIQADFLIALASFASIGVLGQAGLLPASLLVAITAVASLTNPLSTTGLRSILPLLVPDALLSRANAVDANGYVVATLLAPPIAAGLCAIVGASVTLIVISAIFGIAAAVLSGSFDPRAATQSAASLASDAWAGVKYTFGNQTLRGLGISLCLVNISTGVLIVIVPVLIVDQRGLGAAAVGAVLALGGITGFVAAAVVGRVDSHGREWAMVVWPMVGLAAAVALLLDNELTTIAVAVGAMGLLNGVLNVGIFTIRQRRTDAAWLGRAFAVSISFNMIGIPIGSLMTGLLVGSSPDLAIGIGAITCLAGALAAAVMVPQHDVAKVDLGRPEASSN